MGKLYYMETNQQHAAPLAPNDGTLWTLADVAHFYRVSKTQVRRWTEQKDSALPFIRLSPRVIRFVPDVVRNWQPPAMAGGSAS